LKIPRKFKLLATAQAAGLLSILALTLGSAGAATAAGTCPAGQHWNEMGGGVGFCSPDASGGGTGGSVEVNLGGTTPPPPAAPPSATVSPAQQKVITSAISALRARNASLGAAVGGVKYGLTGGGGIQQYKGGSIIWNGKAAFILKGAIRTAFNALGAERSYISYPISNEVSGLKNRGTVQHFRNGDIYWSSASGAHTVVAARTTLSRNGGVNGRLGYPVAEPVRGSSAGSWSQKFQGGTIVHYAGLPELISWRK
jgi:hypothetical protein